MKATISTIILVLVTSISFSQSYNGTVFYEKSGWDGISANCNVSVIGSTTQNGVYFESILVNIDIKTLTIAQKLISGSQIPSHVKSDISNNARVELDFDVYVNNVLINRNGQPTIYWAQLQGLPNSDNYKPAVRESGYALYNNRAIAVRNVRVKNLSYRVDQTYYDQVRKDIAGANNNTSANSSSPSNGNSGSTELLINGQGSVTSGATTTKPIDNYNPNTGLYTNPLTVNSSSSTTNQNSTSNNTTTTQPLDNYDPSTGLYSNPLATYNSSNTSEILQNYETGVQIANTAVAIFDLFSPSAEELAARERAETLRIQKEEEAARARAEKIHRITKRKALIKQYPDGKTPLSYEAKSESEVYFFAYSHTPSEIENSSPIIYISNVFPLKKYGDGTWQFKTNLMDKISKINNGVTLILCGFYLSKNEAEQKHMYFLSKAQNSGFSVATLKVPDIKNTSTPSAGVDFWGNQSTTNNSESEIIETNVKLNDSITTSATSITLDFWGNPIKSAKLEQNIPAEKKHDSTKTKTKFDFWGNPIKN